MADFKVVAVNDAALVQKILDLLGVTEVPQLPAPELAAESTSEDFEVSEEAPGPAIGDVVEEDENDLRFKRVIYVGNPDVLTVEELYDNQGVWVLVETSETDAERETIEKRFEFSSIINPRETTATYDDNAKTLTIRAYKVPAIPADEPCRSIGIDGWDVSDDGSDYDLEDEQACDCEECVAERGY